MASTHEGNDGRESNKVMAYRNQPKQKPQTITESPSLPAPENNEANASSVQPSSTPPANGLGFLISMPAKGEPPSPIATKMPCSCCGQPVWMFPSGIKKLASEHLKLLCFPCLQAEYPDLAKLPPNMPDEENLQEVMAATGRSRQEILDALRRVCNGK